MRLYYGNNDWRDYLAHHGIKGQKWGVRNGPPYPLKRSNLIKDAIDNGIVISRINPEKQARHIQNSKGYIDGRSYLFATEDPDKLIKQLSGTGRALLNNDGSWNKMESVTADHYIGVDVNPKTGKEKRVRKAIIHYSNTGTHIVPGCGRGGK